MRMREAMIGLGLAALVVTRSPRRAEALVFKDVAAFLQRNAHYLIQFQQLLSATRDSRRALLAAYAGLKDWRNLGWVDTLDLVHAPWFDGVEGIDDLRMAADLTALNVEQAQKLSGSCGSWTIWSATRATAGTPGSGRRSTGSDGSPGGRGPTDWR